MGMLLNSEKLLQWSVIEHDLYEENGYIFVVDIDLFNNQKSYYYKTTDEDGTEYYQFCIKRYIMPLNCLMKY